MPAYLEVEEPGDAPQQVIRGDVIIEPESPAELLPQASVKPLQAPAAG